MTSLKETGYTIREYFKGVIISRTGTWRARADAEKVLPDHERLSVSPDHTYVVEEVS